MTSEADIKHWLPYILAGLLLAVAVIRLMVWSVRCRRAPRSLAEGSKPAAT